jgi:glycosyltransferase involved in cell wall biosynthesis
VNIAFLSFFNGLSNRGAETFVHEVASRLARDFQICVYQNGKSDANLPYSTKYLPSLQSLPQFDPKPDVIIPTNGRIQAILARIWAMTHQVKVIISGQSGSGFDDRLNLYTFPDIFVGLTDFQVAWAKQVNPVVKVVKIPNGVHLKKFNPKVTPFTVNLPRPVILYVAALEQIKRHNLLIEAIAQTPASLLLVGQGSLEQAISDYGNHQLGPERFKIMSLPYSQMPGIYTGCDLFVYPTAPWESFGIAILEALASGLPVVATTDPIRTEIVGDAGLLADPTDPVQFAAVITRALNSNWGNKPTLQAAKFSWEAIAQKYGELCKSL